jgi:hypothetical protein
MPRKPNYRHERQERDRIKAAKKAARLAELQNKSAGRDPEEAPATEVDSPDGDPEVS